VGTGVFPWDWVVASSLASWLVGVKASPAMPVWPPDEWMAGMAPSPEFREVWVSVEAMPLETAGAGVGGGGSEVGVPEAAP